VRVPWNRGNLQSQFPAEHTLFFKPLLDDELEFWVDNGYHYKR